MDVVIPKLRAGSYFPDWLLERRRRAERALTTVVATCYLLGVSTRRMEKLVETLGITGLSKSQVSVMAREAKITRERVCEPVSAVCAAAEIRVTVIPFRCCPLPAHGRNRWGTLPGERRG